MKNSFFLLSLTLFSLSLKGELPSGMPKEPIELREQDVIEELTEKYKKEYNAHEADPLLNEITQKALKACGITEPIIVLQCNDTYISRVVCTPSKNPQQFIILGTKQSLDAIIAAIYHEIGHIAHKHVALNTIPQDTLYYWSTKGLSILAGIATCFGLQKYVCNMPIASTLAGGFSALSTLLTLRVFIPKYKHSLTERDADIFAYTHLIEQQRLSTALGKISDHLYHHEFWPKSLPAYVGGYPSDFERAQCGIKILQEKCYDINQLIHNLPEDLDQGVKDHFPEQIKKYFPELIEKQ